MKNLGHENMLKKLLPITAILASIAGNAHAGDIYMPAISVSDYEKALQNNESITFKSTKLPDRLKDIAIRTFGSAIKENTNSDNDTILSPRIIAGSNASRGEYPEFTQLLVEDSGSLFPICGATLIDNQKVLTAAHCSTEPLNYFFIPNFYAFSDFSSGIPSDEIFFATSRRIHPNFTETNTRIDNDVAVFTLENSASTKRATLYDGENDGRVSALSGFNGTVIGTGLLSSQTGQTPNVLQEVAAPIVSNAVCQAAWGPTIQITSTVICAGFTNSDRGSCNGDSGGPLWATVNGERVQAGVVSFGPVDCSFNSEVFGGYSRVSALASFIRQNAPGASFSSDPDVNITPVYQLLLD